MIIKFPALIAATGLTVSAPLVFASAAFSQSKPQSTQQSVVEFMADSQPSACSLQVANVSIDQAEAFTTDVLDTVGAPITNCEAVSGTDDGDSKNFNFLNLTEDQYYKIITESEAEFDPDSGLYGFSILGVKIVPLNADGSAADLSEVEYLYPSDAGYCLADVATEPHELTCLFEVESNNQVLVGRLDYSW